MRRVIAKRRGWSAALSLVLLFAGGILAIAQQPHRADSDPRESLLRELSARLGIAASGIVDTGSPQAQRAAESPEKIEVRRLTEQAQTHKVVDKDPRKLPIADGPQDRLNESLAEQAESRSIIQDDYTLHPGLSVMGPTAPGIRVASTTYEYQHNDAAPHQIATNGSGKYIHFAWTHSNAIPASLAGMTRLIKVNTYNSGTASFIDGVDGTTISGGGGDSALARAGYVTLDIADNDTVSVSFHQRAAAEQPSGDYSSWVLQRRLPSSPLFDGYLMAGSKGSIGNAADDMIWPHVTVDQIPTASDVIHVVAHPYATSDNIVYWRFKSTDVPQWKGPYAIDSTFSLSYNVAADRTSDKIALITVNDAVTGGNPNGLLQVVYRESATNGNDWGPVGTTGLGDAKRTFITNYNAAGGPQAWQEVVGDYDNSGNLHVVWVEQHVAVTTNRAALKHWDKASSTISSIARAYFVNNGATGGRDLNIAYPTMGFGDGTTTCGGGSNLNYLYVTFVQFGGPSTAQQSDMSSKGYMNGEIFLSTSNNGGLLWSPAVNLTNSMSSGCDPAAGDSCASENWPSIARTVDDTLHILYINDRDAGDVVFGQGTWTYNPVMYYRIPGGTDVQPVCPLIAPNAWVELSDTNGPACEYHSPPNTSISETLTLSNTGIATMAGIISRQYLSPPTGTWLQTTTGDYSIPAGGSDLTYQVTMNAAGLTEGIYSAQISVTHNDPTKTSPFVIPVDFFVFNSFDCSNLPDLRCYAPIGWAGSVVVSNESGTNTQSRPFAGQTAYIDWAIANTGGSATSVRFYRRILVDGVQIDSSYFDPPLDANYYISATDHQYVFATAGDHTVRLEGDYTNQIVESDESNNACEYVVTVLPAQPDLYCFRPDGWDGSIVVSNQAGTNTESPALAGQPAYIDCAVINGGGAATSSRFYSRILVDWVEVGSWYTDPPLNVNSLTTVEDFQYTFTTPGYHTVRLEADYTSQVAESDESDNAWEKLVIVYSPDPGGVPILDSSLERVDVRTGSGGADLVTSLAAQDFDGDENLDLVFGSWSMGAGVCFGDGHGGFIPPAFIESGYFGIRAVGAAFVNSDPFPDIITTIDGLIRVYLSRGDRTFAPAIATGAATDGPVGFATGYINGDPYIDLVTADGSGSKAEVYLGNGDGTFTSVGSPFLPFGVTSVGLADMNNDGNRDAIIVGPKAAIFLGDGTGNFALSDSMFIGVSSSYNMQSSFRGDIVDFNLDGLADFVTTSTPVTAGVPNYHVDVFLGDGAGNIASHVVLPLNGVSYPVAVLDYNYDGLLDLAVASSQMQWIYIFQGDGAGGFTHTRSLVSSPSWPASMIVGDFRQDGRWDFIVGDPDGTVWALLNTAPPFPVLDSQMVTLGLNDVQLRVTNPLGLAVSNLGNSIAGARIGDRDADSNGVLDQQITDLNLQTGNYDIAVSRVPNAAPGNRYTLLGGIDAHTERLRFAVNASLPPPGDTFHFSWAYGAASAVEPPTGTFVSSTQPTFDWSVVTASSKRAVRYEFELDDYWDFASPEFRDTNLTQQRFTPATPLLNDTLYYWRFRAFDGSTWGQYSATYVVNTLPLCGCPSQGDLAPRPLSDGVIDVFDVIEVIGIAFSGSPDIQDPLCPTTRGDVDNNGVTDVFDVIYLIATAFSGGPNPVDPCGS